MAQQRVNGVNLYDEDRGDGAPIVLIHGRRRRTSVSRVRENRMPGSMRRREESSASRPSRTAPGASRRPYRDRGSAAAVSDEEQA